MDADFVGPSISEFFPFPNPAQIAFAVLIVIVVLAAASAVIAIVVTRRSRRPGAGRQGSSPISGD
jgi:hypothetical protein